MKKTAIILMIAISFIVVSCSTHVHNVGTGPQTGQVVEARQWYILFGLVPLNDIDTGAMAGDAVNYQIKTETAFLDVLIGIPAGYITVSSRTVTVTK